MTEVVKKKLPIVDENGQSATYPTFADQVFMSDGRTVESIIMEIVENGVGVSVPSATGVSF